MKTFLQWLIISSSDSSKVSLTVKAFLGGLIPVLTIVLGFAHVQVGDLTPVVDAFIAVIQAFFTFLSALLFLYGLGRKIYLTLMGQHEGLQQ